MTKGISSVEEQFDACAGATFGFAGSILPTIDEASDKQQLFVWLLVSHALAVGGDQGGSVTWLQDQVIPLASRSTMLGDLLRERLAHSWAAWVPILLMSAPVERDIAWAEYCTVYHVDVGEEATVREILYRLISEHGRAVFTADGLRNPAKASSPHYCAIVKLGQTVSAMMDSATASESRQILAGWREILLGLTKRLPGRITRGFAPAHAHFQDLVLSLQSVADWLLEPDPRQIARFIEDYRRRPDERLTLDQMALSTGLWGWLQGYGQVGGLIQDRAWRALLAEQAMAIVTCHGSIQGEGTALTDPVAFYATSNGTRRSLRRCLQLKEVQREKVTKVREVLNTATWNWEKEVTITPTRDSAEYEFTSLPGLQFEFSIARAQIMPVAELTTSTQ